MTHSHLEPKNLPETYYCLECLLRLTGNATDARIERVGLYLSGIALMRRALWVGYTEGEITGEISFSKRLGESGVLPHIHYDPILIYLIAFRLWSAGMVSRESKERATNPSEPELLLPFAGYQLTHQTYGNRRFPGTNPRGYRSGKGRPEPQITQEKVTRQEDCPEGVRPIEITSVT